MSRNEGTPRCEIAPGLTAEEPKLAHPGNRDAVGRRAFLRRAATTGAAIGALDFLSYFNAYGMPQIGKAQAKSSEKAREADNPHFLIYWYIEGGWESYDMFGPVITPNNVVQRLPPERMSEETYRVLKFGEPGYGIYKEGNIRYGYLAEGGKSLFRDMAVISSMDTGEFHSGERLRVHLGNYKYSLQAEREDDERTVMQAFAEVYGQPYIMPHLSWHYWLSDGELNEQQYTGRKGYYGNLGPSWAHTNYAGTPANLKSFLLRMQATSSDVVNQQIEKFLGDIEPHLRKDSDAEVVKSYDAASQAYEGLAKRGSGLDRPMLTRLFADPELRARFDIKPADELITYRSVNGNKARTKFSPAVNVQAMMTYEMMRAGLSCAFFIETRNIREFDSHYNRAALWAVDRRTPRGQPDQTNMMHEQLWKPLNTLVELLKSTPYRNSGKSLWDYTTIVLTSEFGRTIRGDVEAIRALKISDDEKQKMVDGQDISQHWKVTSAAFLGGKVKGNSQYGGVGERTLLPIPLLPDGAMDPSFDPISGLPKPGMTKNPAASVPDHGDIYATALYVADIDPKGHGRNERGPLRYVKL